MGGYGRRATHDPLAAAGAAGGLPMTPFHLRLADRADLTICLDPRCPLGPDCYVVTECHATGDVPRRMVRDGESGFWETPPCQRCGATGTEADIDAARL